MTLSRRTFLKSSGFLVVGIAAAGPLTSWSDAAAAEAAGPYPDPDYLQLDSWIVIHQDNTATFYVGKTDCGQGTGTAFRQMMSDELDIAVREDNVRDGQHRQHRGPGRLRRLRRDSNRRLADAPRGRRSRRVLLEMAATRFAVPVDQLVVSNAVIAVKADPSKTISYGDLIGGKQFHVTLTGNNIDATTGLAKVKPVQELKMVGQSPQRYDIPAKVDGSLKWAVDVKLPGMVHARNVKPPVAGATLVSIDESSVRSIPGFVKVVSKGNYVAVVCEREEQAVRAAKQLKVDWKKPATAPFPTSEGLYAFMRSATPTSKQQPNVKGNPDAAFASAAKVVDAEYDMPFQGHTAFAPAHALADPSNGQMTVYSNDMKSYGMRNGLAQFLGMPREQVRVVWLEGPQGYGRTAADDAGFEAAYLAKELGRPVRVQWMRHEETGWDTKGPAFTFKIRGGLDAQGNLVARRLRRAGGRLRPRRLQRARHGAHRAADGKTAREAGRWQRGNAVRHVRDSEPPHGVAGREPAARVGDAAAHGKPARPERPAGDVRRRIVHRRNGGRRARRSGGVSAADAHGRARPTTAASSARARSPS